MFGEDTGCKQNNGPHTVRKSGFLFNYYLEPKVGSGYSKLIQLDFKASKLGFRLLKLRID